jgi:hypothetical protein
MSWNYRVIHMADGSYGIYEVYYGDDGMLQSRSVEPIGVWGDSFEELRMKRLNRSFTILQIPVKEIYVSNPRTLRVVAMVTTA